MQNKLELILRHVGRDLAQHQVARFFKVPEELQWTPCDFFGYTSCGRAILLEAKMVNRQSLPIGNEPGLQVHQWNELLAANRAGALALIAWAVGDTVATISIDMAIAYSEGRKSIPWKAIPDHYRRRLNMADRLQILDQWLPLSAGCT